MSSFILTFSVMAALQTPPETKYERLVHVVDKNTVMRVVQLPHHGNVDARYTFTTEREAVSDEEIIWEALTDCKYANFQRRGESAQQYDQRRANNEPLLEQLLRIEKKYGVPDSLRGMLLAAACHESGYNHKARGDRKFSKNKKRYLAKGLFQMWPWWEKAYKIDRTNPVQSANAYLTHVKRQVSKVGKVCGKRIARNNKKTWIVGWATAIRAPKAGGRCYEKPRFYRVLKRWHKNIKKHRKQMENCGDNMDGCGC